MENIFLHALGCASHRLQPAQAGAPSPAGEKISEAPAEVLATKGETEVAAAPAAIFRCFMLFLISSEMRSLF